MNFRPELYYLSLYLIVSGFYMYIKSTLCCPLPLSAGVWYSSSRGNWTISDGGMTVMNFRASLTAQSQEINLTCDSVGSTSTQYILRTNLEIFFGVFIDGFTCLDIQSTSNQYTYLYYIVTPEDPATEETFTSDKTTACSNSDYLNVSNQHILITELQSVTDYPAVIMGNYSTTDGSKLNDSSPDSTTDTTTLKFSNNDATVKQAFSRKCFLFIIIILQHLLYTPK